ncbi:MAG: HprK-related kinase A [Gammaproteobacteria bacterium]|nr:HprK-related kinase A [Gammaproteobacteria bacterium]MBI5618882.1 HprK-related kinase A [Gammaproteobacteria bacterium]
MNAPLTIRTLGAPALARELEGDGLRFQVGPFVAGIKGSGDGLAEMLSSIYPDYPLAADGSFADAIVSVERLPAPLRPWRRTGLVRLDDGTRFSDFPLPDALPYVEWSINWCIATRAHQYLMLHAGVLARGAAAMILPGLPGAGKSTLSAYLMHHGWRLLSDEFTLVDADLSILPLPRLIPLKNESIDVIRRACPDAELGPSFAGTRKGTVAHACPPAAHVRDMAVPAKPRLVVYPRYERGAALKLDPIPRSECFVEISNNAFNYAIRGEAAFVTASALVERVDCYRLCYGDLAEAGAALAGLLDSLPPVEA